METPSPWHFFHFPTSSDISTMMIWISTSHTKWLVRISSRTSVRKSNYNHLSSWQRTSHGSAVSTTSLLTNMLNLSWRMISVINSRNTSLPSSTPFGASMITVHATFGITISATSNSRNSSLSDWIIRFRKQLPLPHRGWNPHIEHTFVLTSLLVAQLYARFFVSFPLGKIERAFIFPFMQ